MLVLSVPEHPVTNKAIRQIEVHDLVFTKPPLMCWFKIFEGRIQRQAVEMARWRRGHHSIWVSGRDSPDGLLFSKLQEL